MNVRKNYFPAGSRLVVAFLSLSVFAQSVAAQGRTQQLAITGQSITAGEGTLQSLRLPALNNRGRAAFNASFVSPTSGGDAIILSAESNEIWSNQMIAARGDSIPGGFGSYTDLESTPNLNDALHISFLGNYLSGSPAADTGIFFSQGGIRPSTFALEGQASPGGSFGEMQFSPRMNSSGQLVFHSAVNPVGGGPPADTIFRATGSTYEVVADRGTLAPDGNGVVESFGFNRINDAGDVIFRATLNQTAGGTSDDQGLFRWNGSLSTVLRKGDALPTGGGTFGNFLQGDYNNSGQLVFEASHVGIGLGNSGIYFNDGTTNLIARQGQLTPNGIGSFGSFWGLQVNNAGQSLFFSDVSGESDGLFVTTPGGLQQVVREGDSTSIGSATINDLYFIGQKSLNDGGQIAYGATLSNTAAGVTDDAAIFITDRQQTLTAVQKGTIVDGSAIDTISFRSEGFNNLGQLAYQAGLVDGRDVIRVFTPDLHWRNGSSGSWNNTNNWTLSLAPGLVHRVFVDPAVGATIFGPTTDTHVRQLVVGGGSGNATLLLQDNITLEIDNGLAVTPNGALAGSGMIEGDVSVRGTLRPSTGPTGVGEIRISGDLELVNSTVQIDLFGASFGEYDYLSIGGEMTVGGSLSVFVDPLFQLGPNMMFLFADVGKRRIGEFDGLSNFSLVGNYGGRDLFITYTAGDGNDIALFTAVPEPTFGGLALAGVIAVFLGQRRNRNAPLA